MITSRAVCASMVPHLWGCSENNLPGTWISPPLFGNEATMGNVGLGIGGERELKKIGDFVASKILSRNAIGGT